MLPLGATQAASLIATYRIESLRLRCFMACYGTTNITAFYVNIWKIDNATGVWTLADHYRIFLIHLSRVYPGWNFYELANPLATVAGEQYAFELAPAGFERIMREEYPMADTIPDHPYAAIVGVCCYAQ